MFFRFYLLLITLLLLRQRYVYVYRDVTLLLKLRLRLGYVTVTGVNLKRIAARGFWTLAVTSQSRCRILPRGPNLQNFDADHAQEARACRSAMSFDPGGSVRVARLRE